MENVNVLNIKKEEELKGFKFLIKASSSRGGRKSPDGITINTGTIAIRKNEAIRLNLRKGHFGSIGFNSDSQLCLITCEIPDINLRSITDTGITGKSLYIQIPKESKDLFKSFLGNYIIDTVERVGRYKLSTLIRKQF